LKNDNGNVTAVYGQNNTEGIGGVTLEGTQDLGLVFDYGQKGEEDYLVLYRPGTGAIFIIKGS
jgi:hypothetical protein